MKRIHIVLMSLFVVMAFSCMHKKPESTVVTEQIQYDVRLQNPDSLPDDRHRYLDDTTRIHFLKSIIDPALSGEATVYVWDNKFRPATVEELKNRFAWPKSKPVPDTIDAINYLVDLHKITKIRYYEEWTMEKKSLQIDKRVMGISLILDNYDETGTFRGTEPLFYIFYDNKLKTELEKQFSAR